MEIRAARPADHPTIERIEEAADARFIDTFEPDSWPAATSVAERLEQRGFILVGTSPEGTLLGFAHVIEISGLAHLEQVSVLPEHARRGHGRALVQAAMDEARARGYSRITLRTYADLDWNGPFYARLGFSESAPSGEFLLGLVEVEREMGLDRYGRRVQMTAVLDQ